MREINIGSLDEHQRLNKYLLKYLNNSSSSYIYKMLRKKRIKLNNKRADGSEILNNGDKIQMYLSDETIENFMNIKFINIHATEVEVVYEDENILICNKPIGVLSHPENKEDDNTMIDRILYYLYKKGEYNINLESTFTPALCNRLDRNTSGIIVCGKNLKASQHLNNMFHEKNISKYYITIVKGVTSSHGTLKGYHVKDKDNNQVNIYSDYVDNSNEVITKYKMLNKTESYTFLEIELITGKSHQIRAHLQKINHSIVGDTKYGDKKINKYIYDLTGLKNQLLHSQKLVFKDKNGFLSYLYGQEFLAKRPDIFTKTLKMLLLD